ncbi:guanylate kinase [Candidatus Peregrinibacteria bacterium]|nr:guanylate kinase [Candidatus Peregrinibacteria bacterium]
MKGKLVLIIGPSGVGKSVIFKSLKKKHPEFHFPRSATTRLRRQGETDAIYHFVNDQEFEKIRAEGAFLECAKIHNGAWYGTLLKEILPAIEDGKTVVREVDVQGFESIRNHQKFSGHSAPYKLQSIFILPENREQLIGRITHRAPISDDELKRRIKSMDSEMTYAKLCDVQILNKEGRLEESIRSVEKAILK